MVKGAGTLENGWLEVCRLPGVPPLTTTASALSASPPCTLAVWGAVHHEVGQPQRPLGIVKSVSRPAQIGAVKVKMHGHKS